MAAVDDGLVQNGGSHCEEDGDSDEPRRFTVKIRNGKDYTVHKAYGMLLPTTEGDQRPFWENLPKLKDFKMRDDDVFVLAYPRSGTHWIQEAIGMLLNGNTKPLPHEKERTMFELGSLDVINETPSPRILSTHYWPLRQLPIHMLKTGRIVHVVRNPKDVLVSKYTVVRNVKQSPFHGDFGDYADLFTRGEVTYESWFDYELEFEELSRRHPDIKCLLVYYEEMIKNPIETMKRICSHLCLDRDDALLSEVHEATRIDKMRTYAQQRRGEDVAIVRHGEYRKGVIGDWKNWFKVSDNETFDKFYAEKMKNSTLKFTYESV